MNDQYQPKTAPFPHQLQAFQASCSKRAYAYLMDPGLGKTKLTIDTAAYMFERGYINALLVVAPNDVHAQWLEEQMPLHLPDRIKWRGIVWRANRTFPATAIRNIVKHHEPDVLHVLAMNMEALATQKGVAHAEAWLKAFKCLFVLDDSHEFGSPKALRTRAAMRLAPLAVARRILTGTLTGGQPFKTYSQMCFLDERILGEHSFVSFRSRYGIFRQRRLSNGRSFPELLGYQNLEQLRDKYSPYSFICHKGDVVGLPPKLPQTVPTHLSGAQRDLYRTLVNDGMALLEAAEQGKPVKVQDLNDFDPDEQIQGATSITYKIKLTLILRLQQIAAGIVRTDDGKVSLIDGTWENCPKLHAAARYIEEFLDSSPHGKIIVWCHFRPALEALDKGFHELNQPGFQHVLVHGDIKGEERATRLAAFKSSAPGTPRVLLAHPRTLGTGQDMPVATTVLFVTRPWSLIQRLQAEDRAHRLTSKGTVTIADLIAHDSPIDRKEMEVLSTKQSLMDRLEKLNANALRTMLQLEE
jgi:SNF2 family DNA or RNA helicase